MALPLGPDERRGLDLVALKARDVATFIETALSKDALGPKAADADKVVAVTVKRILSGYEDVVVSKLLDIAREMVTLCTRATGDSSAKVNA